MYLKPFIGMMLQYNMQYCAALPNSTNYTCAVALTVKGDKDGPHSKKTAIRYWSVE